MEGKILVTLLIFLVFLLYVKSTSTYTPTDAGADWHSQYQNIGMDIDEAAYGAGNIYLVTNDQALSQEQINYKMWVNFASIDASLTAPAGSKPIWGFRKQLQIGGNGTVEYLVTDPTGTGGGTNYQTVKAVAIDTTVFNTVTYVIPNYIIVKRSLISPVITCDSNATAGGALDINGQPQSCTCKAGYYGNGSVCYPCPAGSYCPGGANALPCAVNVSVPGASPATTRSYTSAPGSTISSACYLPCAFGATSSAATTTSGATCSCQTGNWGTGYACNLCSAGTAGTGTTGAVGVVTKCPDCAPGTVQPSTGRASCNSCLKNQYSNAPTRTTCNNCAAGTYSLAASADACTNCTSGYSSLAGQDCTLFATSAALQGYMSSNSPCQGTWNVTTPATPCPATCPYAGGNVPGAGYTWTTSIAATGTGTCPPATSTASPVSCPANNCNASGYYNMATPATPCPATCPYAGGNVAGAGYTWTTTTPATGTGTTPPATSTAASPSCGAVTIASCLPITLTSMGATGPYGPSTVTYSPNKFGVTVSSGIQQFTVPYTRPYTFVVTAAGGQNGSSYSGGNGAVVTATITLNAGQTVYCVVGQCGIVEGGTGMSGGGGSFVMIDFNAFSSTVVGNANRVFIAAGGGGGASATTAGGDGQGATSATPNGMGVQSAYSGIGIMGLYNVSQFSGGGATFGAFGGSNWHNGSISYPTCGSGYFGPNATSTYAPGCTSMAQGCTAVTYAVGTNKNANGSIVIS